MPLRDDILNPIPGDNPSGQSLRYAPLFDKIKEARRQDDDAPQGEWARERKQADWPLTIKLISEALATKTKDLQLAAWLTEALLRKEGISGLQEGLELIRALIETYWDTLYPELEDGDPELRASPLEWVATRLELPIKGIPLTRSGLTWLQYKESRAVGSEESADTDEKRQARQEAIAEGKITMEAFDEAFAASPKAFYVRLVQNFDDTLETLGHLSELCDEKFGDLSPSFGTLQSLLEEVRQTAVILLNKKRETEPDAPPPPAEEPAVEEAAEEQTPYEAAMQAMASYVQTAAPPRRAAPATLSIEPADREDAIARVVAVARYLRQQDAYSPAPYLMLRGLRWGELRAGGPTIDPAMLAAPPGEIRQNLKRLAMEYNWAEVLETAETAMGMECGRGWLDLQRYAGRACYELGYEAILSAIKSELRALLADYPDLPRLTLMDDTATANAETVAWIQENCAPAGAPAADSMPRMEAFPTSDEEAMAAASAAAQPDVFDLAMHAVREGRPQEGMELLTREMVHERSGRGRFHRKVQLAQLCVAIGHDAIARPILKELAEEIERRRLEDWEASEMVAHPLALLYGCLKDDSEEEKQKLYAWICRLDPLKALTVTK